MKNIAIILSLLVVSTYSCAQAKKLPLQIVTTQHDVVLSWIASPTSGVTGYNIYRSTVSGGPYTKIGTTTAPAVTYDDMTVDGTVNLFYVVTAFNTMGESTYSNEAAAVYVKPSPATNLKATPK